MDLVGGNVGDIGAVWQGVCEDWFSYPQRKVGSELLTPLSSGFHIQCRSHPLVHSSYAVECISTVYLPVYSKLDSQHLVHSHTGSPQTSRMDTTPTLSV